MGHILEIVDNVERFAEDIDRPIRPLGIVATKVQSNNLHQRLIGDLKGRRLGRFADGGLSQPSLFENTIPQTVAAARGADAEADIRTLKGKYGDAYSSLYGLTQEIKQLCEKKKALVALLQGLVDLLADEAARNPKFADRVASLLSDIPEPRAKPSKTNNSPRLEQLPDIHAEWTVRGEPEFRLWLKDQPVQVLRAIIRREDLDSTRRTAKWSEQEKLAAFIADGLSGRLSRGSAFIRARSGDP